MAKRAVDGTILFDGIDLNTATISGMYRCSHNNPNIPSSDYGQLLVVHGGVDTIAQIYFPFDHTAAFVRTGSPPEINGTTQWGDWEQLAVCTAPEVHELPLASGFPAQSYANTYYKTQEGIVHLNFCIFRGASTAFAEQETICTMPEGFRPSQVIAAAVCGDGLSFNAGLPSAELHIETDGRMWFYGANARINWVYGEITYLAG